MYVNIVDILDFSFIKTFVTIFLYLLQKLVVIG